MSEKVFLVPYEWLYDQVFANIRPLYYFLIVLWIVALFYCMYSIADRHFTWALEHLARACRLSPDLAGLTLLAFGNGAPDFFTAIFGAAEEPEMILGSSVGSGLFIVTVVFGMVLVVARKPGKGRMVVLEDGETKVLVTEEEQEMGLFKCYQVTHALEPIPFFRGVGMYLLCVGLLFLFALIKVIPFWLPLVLLAIYFVYLGVSLAMHFGSSKKRRRGTLSKAESEVLETRLSEQEMNKALEHFEQLNGCIDRCIYAIKTTCWKNSWCEGGRTLLISHLILALIKAPINLILNLTILPIEDPEDATDADNYVTLRYLHRWRCIVNPFFSIILYILLLGPELKDISWVWWVSYGVASVLVSVFLILTTSWTAAPRFFALHLAYSFSTSILWIYATSKELLDCLSSTGSSMGISPTVMGILVLAWGNSFGDLVADVAIAKNGSLETAVTAIFSGPVQNVLLTIGAGFLVAALRMPTHKVILGALRSDIYLALAVLATVLLVCLVMIPLRFDFKVSRTFGFMLLAVYIVYLPCALVLGLGLIKL